MTTKTLELAISRATALPEAAQEQLGREMLERMESLAALRAEIEEGLAELDAGKGEELNIESLIRNERRRYASACYCINRYQRYTVNSPPPCGEGLGVGVGKPLNP